MKQLRGKLISLLLCFALLLGGTLAASAAFEDFTDVKGHWAENTLRQAYQDGILKGYEGNIMAPNDSVTTAQAVTMLCRVLHVTGKADVSDWGIPAGAWYREDVAKAAYAGLLTKESAPVLNEPIARVDAFLLFDRAFQMSNADPDRSVLSAYPDARFLTGETQRVVASLVESGIINGTMGQLQLDRSLTRAEFATILYRLADQYTTADQFTGASKVGTVVSGDAALNGMNGGDVWFDHATSSVILTDFTASTVTLRSDTLTGLEIAGKSQIDRLVLAAGSGDVTLDLPEESQIGTLVVGSGEGKVSFRGALSGLEITGNGRTVELNTSVDRIVVSGEGNTISVKQGCTVGEIILRGKENTVKLDGKAKELVLAGRDHAVTGWGRADHVTLQTNHYKLSVSRGSVTQWENYGLEDVSVKLDAPSKLKAGETLRATAKVSVPEEHQGKLCTAVWYINDEEMDQTPFLLGEEDPVSAITPNYTHDLKQDATVKVVIRYENTDGDAYTQEASEGIWLDTFEDLGLADAVVTVSAPERLAAGEQLVATAQIETPEKGKVCKGYWYVDGKEVASDTYVLGSGVTTLRYGYDYYYGMPETSTVSYRLTYTTEDGRAQEVTGKTTLTLENYADNGIAHATASLTAPNPLPAGKTLDVTAQIKYPEAGKVCTGEWYVDGKLVSTQTITLGKDTPRMTHKYTYTEDMKTTSKLQFILRYTTEDGRAQQVTATKTITLENYDYLYYHNLTPQQVLGMVTSKYAGNYTLSWAQTHDYPKEIKTAWVNLKGYSSKTQYLVWVNLTYQRVNIFTGYQGHWKLVRECLCGAGKASTPTIRGVFTTSYKQPAWDYGSYYCGPIVRFYGSSGYAFHSRLQYWPMNSNRYYDARIGFPISHGCLRMYNDDIWYMYNNIPNGTTVVVY